MPATATAERIGISHLMYVRYKHKDIHATHKFLIDFGLETVQQDKSIAYYRGFGENPVVYVSEQASDGQSAFLGGGWAVDSYKDLEQATKLATASSIVDCDGPIGGKMVSVQDPAGGPMYLHWGFHTRSKDDIEKPKQLVFNTWENKQRLGDFQRLPDGPSHIHKLGHYGYEVSHANFEAVRQFYFERFTFAPSDSLYDPKTGKDVMIFAHVDKGDQFTDHHVREPRHAHC